MHPAQTEPQRAAPTDELARALDGLMCWINLTCSTPVHQSWEMAGREKEYSDKLRFIERSLSNAVLRLRLAINPTCPVNKLPPEILTRCFLYLAPRFPLTRGPQVPQHEWIRITHVCKYWRAVVFGFSGFWDRVEFTRPEMLDMYLELSGSRPVEICLQHVGHGMLGGAAHEMVDLLVPVGRRIHSLIIHKDWIPSHDASLFMECSLPELETLSITSDIGWENESIGEPRKRLRALFRGGLPRLRRLFIPEYTPWPHNEFKNLTLLCLYNQYAIEEELPELLQMLRGCPGLQELYIRQHEHSTWIQEPPPDLGPTFPAHSLRKLHLHSFSTKAIVCILSTMVLQPNGVAVNISDTAMHTNTLDRILPLFPQESGLGSAKQLEIYHETDLTFGITYCCTGGSVRIGGDLRGNGGQGRKLATVSLFRYIYQGCARTLKDLWIYNFTNVGGEYIFDHFSCFNLDRLVLVAGGDVADRLCTVLNPRNPEAQGQDLPAPRLRSLVICGVINQGQLKRLVSLCEGRFKSDHPLEKVMVAWDTGDVPEWMTRLCSLSPTPVHINTNEWDGQMMELRAVCINEPTSWWPSWDEPIIHFNQYNS